MTATIVQFSAGASTGVAATQLTTLAPGATDAVVSWQDNNEVYVAKILRTS